MTSEAADMAGKARYYKNDKATLPVLAKAPLTNRLAMKTLHSLKERCVRSWNG